VNRTVLLDRDGVLNVDRPDYVLGIHQLIIERGAAAGVAALAALGCRLLVITNQASVAKGLISRADLDALNAEINRRTGGHISEFFVCPHFSHDGCDCRKPKPGLILQAQAKYGFDPAETWMVGDAERDAQAALAAGCQAALLRTGKGATPPPGVPQFDDLPAFAAWYKAHHVR
jgi:D-glycero-D-manno-heptose 1,7-bisphosphate phosphatase